MKIRSSCQRILNNLKLKQAKRTKPIRGKGNQPSEVHLIPEKIWRKMLQKHECWLKRRLSWCLLLSQNDSAESENLMNIERPRWTKTIINMHFTSIYYFIHIVQYFCEAKTWVNQVQTPNQFVHMSSGLFSHDVWTFSKFSNFQFWAK